MAKRKGNGPAGNGHRNRPRQSNASSSSGSAAGSPSTPSSARDSRLASLTPIRGTPAHEVESTDSGNRGSVSDNGSGEGWQTAPGPKTATRRKFLPKNGGGPLRRDKHELPALKIEGAPDDDDEEEEEEDGVSWGPTTGGGAPAQTKGVAKNPLVFR